MDRDSRGYCDERHGDARCDLDRGHDGPHAMYATPEIVTWTAEGK